MAFNSHRWVLVIVIAMQAIMIASATRSALALVLRCEDAAWKYALTDFQGSYGTPKSAT